jgi:hypothetical protein
VASSSAANEEIAQLAMHPTENVAAYDLYLQGRNALHVSHGLQATESALHMFEEALGKDPNFALAYTGMADASLRMYKETKDAIWAQKALMSAEQAELPNRSRCSAKDRSRVQAGQR